MPVTFCHIQTSSKTGRLDVIILLGYHLAGEEKGRECYLFTVNTAYRPTLLLEALGQLKALEKRLWPFFNKQFLDPTHVDAISGIYDWPSQDGKLLLAQVPALKFHFSDQ